MTKKIKLLYYGDGVQVATGFATVSRNILMGLYHTGKYDITCLAINHHGNPSMYDKLFPSYPIGVGSNDPYGRQRAADMIASPTMEFDVLFMLQDTFILQFMKDVLPKLKSMPNKNFASIVYFPIDGVPKTEWIQAMAMFDKCVAYTEFGKKESILAFPEISDKLSIIPHGANSQDFFPMKPEEIVEFKKSYFGLHADKYILTTVNRNQQRKDIPRTIAAFKMFKELRPNSILYLHMSSQDQGWNLPEVIKAYGLKVGEDILLPGGDFGPNQGYPIEVVNKIYNASDVVVSTTVGEGALRGDTLIYTYSGLVPINEIKVGDKVFTHKGRYQEVSKILKVKGPKEVYKLRSYKFNEPLYMTNDHPVLTERGFVRADELRDSDVVLFARQTEIEDTEVVDLAEYLVGTSRFAVDDKFIICNGSGGKRINRYIPLNADVMWLLGLYLAEGSVSSGTLSFSLHEDEVDIHSKVTRVIDKYFNTLGEYLSPVFVLSKKDKSGAIKFSSVPVCSFFKSNCGANSYTKDIPQWAKKLPAYKLEALVKGMVDGDGDGPNANNWQKFRYKTVSQKMAYSFRDCLLELGELPSVALEDNSYGFGDGNIYTVVVHRRSIGEPMNATTFKRKAHVEGGYVKMQLLSIEKVEGLAEEDYYDLSVPGDNSYTTSTATVHNCGLSSLEAMATKTPIIFPRNTSLEEIIGKDEERGFLINCGSDPSMFTVLPNDNEVIRPLVDVNHMVEKMLYVHDNKEKVAEKVERAYNWVTGTLDWQKNIVPVWDKLITEAVKDLENKDSNRVISVEEL